MNAFNLFPTFKHYRLFYFWIEKEGYYWKRENGKLQERGKASFVTEKHMLENKSRTRDQNIKKSILLKAQKLCHTEAKNLQKLCHMEAKKLFLLTVIASRKHNP